MFSQIKENILNRIFILLLGVGLGGAGVKNFSVGICDGAQSTAHSSTVVEVRGLLNLSEKHNLSP